MRQRAAAVGLLAAIGVTACGYNTNDHEVARAVVVEAAGATGTGGPVGARPTGTSSTTGSTTSGAPASSGTTTLGSSPADTGTSAGGGTGTTTPTGDTAGAATGTTPPDADAGTGPSDGADTATEAPTASAGGGTPGDTRAAPPGGNGGATDVGVTETSITITNVVDRTGPVPGLFQDTQEAVQAYLLKFQSEEGTLYGRTLDLVPRDAKMSNQENRAAYLDACQTAFAAVGSMSAFEQGAAPPIEECGIPDIRTTAVTPETQVLPTVRSVMAFQPGLVKLREWEYIAEEWPGAEKNAVFLYVDNATTTYQVNSVTRAAEQELGYQWRTIPIALSEVNYSSIIQQVKDMEAEVVAFQGAYQQAARLGRTMQQQSYTPTVFFLQSNTYTPGLVEEGGAELEGYTILGQTGALLEEQGSNPEMQEYAQWLARVNPRARPTGLGMYAWASMRVFVESARAVGPNLTRTALLEHINGAYTAFDGAGLFPAQNLSSQVPTDCLVIVDVTAAGFVRREPASGGYTCREEGPGDIR